MGSMLPAPFDILPQSPCSLPFFGARSFYQFSLLLFHFTLLPAPEKKNNLEMAAIFVVLMDLPWTPINPNIGK